MSIVLNFKYFFLYVLFIMVLWFHESPIIIYFGNFMPFSVDFIGGFDPFYQSPSKSSHMQLQPVYVYVYTQFINNINYIHMLYVCVCVWVASTDSFHFVYTWCLSIMIMNVTLVFFKILFIFKQKVMDPVNKLVYLGLKKSATIW